MVGLVRWCQAKERVSKEYFRCVTDQEPGHWLTVSVSALIHGGDKVEKSLCLLWQALGSACVTCLETQAISTAGAEIHTVGGNSRNSRPHKR